MKKELLLIVLLSLTLTIFAQAPAKKKSADNIARTTINLNKKEDIIQTVDLGDKGFILKTGVEYAGKEGKVRLHKYRTDLTKVWTVEIPKSTNKLLDNFILASPLSDYTYYIQQSKVMQRSAGKMVVTRIDATGKTTKYDLKVDKNGAKKEGKGKTSTWPGEGENTSYIAAFVDEDNLYLLASLETVNSNKDVKKKNVTKKNSKVVLFTASHKSKTISSHETSIELNADEASADLFIEYLGHDDEHIYVSKKSVNLADKTLTYDILTLNKSGETIDETSFEAAITGLPVPSINFRESYGSVIYNNDYDVEVHTYTSGNRTYTTYTYIANAGSFGCAQLDIANSKFYIYGLSLDKTAKKETKNSKDKKAKKSALEQEANTLYVYQYDFNTGELLQSFEKKLPKEFIADKSLSAPSVFYNRNLWLDVLTDNMIRVNGVANYSMKLHSIGIDLTTDKMEYIGKEVPLRKGSGAFHRTYLTNILACKMESTKEYQQFLKSTTDFRTKEYSVFALLLGDKRIVAKNYSFTKTPKLELTAYPIKGSEGETTE